MTLKRKISGLTILLMLAMQLLLAQHYTVHFQEGLQHVVGSQHKADDKGHAGHDKTCQICVFSKILSYLLLFSVSALLIVACGARGILALAKTHSLQKYSVVYPARGPPPFFPEKYRNFFNPQER